jgi:hypothetical protein
MEWLNMETVKNGLIAGAAVAVMSAAAIALRSNGIAAELSGDGTTVTAMQAASEWIVRWVAISLVFGVIAAAAFNALNGWGLNGTQYLLLGVGLMIVLDVLAFVPMYDGKIAPHAIEWLYLNAFFGIGFGILIPFLAGR